MKIWLDEKNGKAWKPLNKGLELDMSVYIWILAWKTFLQVSCYSVKPSAKLTINQQQWINERTGSMVSWQKV